MTFLSDSTLLFETVEEAFRVVSGVSERTAGQAAEQTNVDDGAGNTELGQAVEDAEYTTYAPKLCSRDSLPPTSITIRRILSETTMSYGRPRTLR